MSEEKKNRSGQAPEGAVLDPQKQIEKFAKGKMTLTTPIQDGEQTVTELKWDFLALTGSEYVDALDSCDGNFNTFRISNSQALSLFATAAAKATKGIDATDIRQRMGIMDAQKAVQLATVFFIFSSRAGNSNISGV